MLTTDILGDDEDVKFESFEPILMSQRLTLEQMLSRFSTLEVDRCIHDLRYPKYVPRLPLSQLVLNEPH